MKAYGLSIDPGLESGICLFSFGPDQAFTVEWVWQFGDGAEGLAAWMLENGLRIEDGKLRLHYHDIIIDVLVVEKFTPRPNENFAPTRKSVEPLRGEGVLLGAGLGPRIKWVEPSQQYFMGGEDLDDKKRRSREFLKLHGMYLTGKNGYFRRPNADDAISATLHGIAYARRKRHMPTLLKMFGPTEERRQTA